MLVKLVSREMSSQCYKVLLMGHKSCVILTDTAITMIYGGNTMKTHHIYHHHLSHKSVGLLLLVAILTH